MEPLAITLSPFDLMIIAVYFFTVLIIGLKIGQGTHTGEDLFLAGRSLGWSAIGFSLFASNISSTTLIGLMGAAYMGGLYVSNYEWMATVILVFFSFFYVPVFLRSRISTMPEFLERRFDRRSRVYFSGLTIITNLFVDTAGSLYAGAVVLQAFFPWLELWPTCLILALVAGFYTAAGGLAAVVYTDVIQAVVMLLGSCFLAYTVLNHPSVGGWNGAFSALDERFFSVINPQHHPLNDPDLPWLGTLIGVPILGFYFWVTNQYIVQRVLGARSMDDARWGALFGGLLKLPVLFIMVLPGVLARLIFPDISNADAVFPTLVTQLLPSGLVGLVMAGLIAAIMSSIDSTLNSTSTLITLDFVKPRRPDMSAKQTLWVGRISIGTIMVLAALWAPQIAHFEGLFKYLQELLSYLVPPITVLFLFGVFSHKGTADGAFLTLVGGHLLSVLMFMGQKQGWLPQFHFTLVAGVGFVLSSLLYWGGSILGKPISDQDLTDLLIGPVPEAQAGWRDYRLQSAALIVLTVALVSSFY